MPLLAVFASGPSVLRRLFCWCVLFGLAMGAVFPFYASVFVEWKPGMLPWFVTGCFVAGLTVGVGNYTLASRVLLSRLRRMSAVVTAISANDLTQRCRLESQDTLGELAAGFNAMATSLQEVIAQLSGRGRTVRTGAEGIQDRMEHTGRRIEEERTRIAEIAGAAERLSQAAGAVAENAADAAERSRTASALADRGGSVVRETTSKIEGLHRFVSRSASAVAALGRRSEQIGEITTMIDDIADQTSLLALNASIEAARAGTHGRGFAVVADEVRKLSEKTAVATRQIATTLSSIRAETLALADAMQNGASETQESVEKAAQAGCALADIETAVRAVSELIDEIASAAGEQTRAVRSIHGEIEGLEGLVSDTKADASAIRDATEELVRDAAALDELARHFRV